MSDRNGDGAADAFSALEEDFFRTGDAMSEGAVESRSDRDAVAVRTSLWSRLFKRTPRPATEPSVADDDWDWQIAVARARHSTGG